MSEQKNTPYISVETNLKTSEQKTYNTFIELREPQGTQLFNKNGLEILAPSLTDFPVDSGKQLQIADRSITTAEIQETPLLSEKVDPKALLRVVAFGIKAEEMLVKMTDNVWANLNFHSRAPISDEAPHPAQYNSLTLDIHGRDARDFKNWTRPPAMHGIWNSGKIEDEDKAWEIVKDSFDDKGEIIPATKEEIQTYKQDPMKRVFTGLHPSDPAEFTDWRSHPTGFYDWHGRRKYTTDEIDQLFKIYQGREFADMINKIQNISLFADENPQEAFFEENETDIELWRFGGYQLVTQRTPLVDNKEGIHMVLKIRPEPHTPWDNVQQTLEAFAIGIGVARILKNTKGLGEIGDVYLDMNANWSMTKKGPFADEQLPLEELKFEIQRDTRAHLHIQLEKMQAQWEIPPAPGTFKNHQPPPLQTIEEIKKQLNDTEHGLKKWILLNCRGRIFMQESKEPVHSDQSLSE